MRLHIIVYGLVQGVGFRKFIRNIARKLNIVGFVKNKEDSTVEILAIGEKANLEKLIEASRKGPFLSQVENLDIERLENSEYFEEFLIKHD